MGLHGSPVSSTSLCLAHHHSRNIMDDAWNELSFDFEPAVQAALPPSSLGNTRDRFRTQVCRHWLRGLCMIGDNCGYLHKMDRNRMPICRWRTDCQVEGCAFRHEEEQEAPECAMYQQGFCRQGPTCRFRHVKRAREDCPEVADFSLVNPTSLPSSSGGGRSAASGGFSRSFGGGSFGGGGGGAGGGAADRGGGGGDHARSFTKTQICKYWASGATCPWGDGCNYAHGEEELRKGGGHGGGGGGFAPRFEVRKDPLTDPEMEAVVPIKEGDKARFFVLRSLNHDNLAVSAVQNKWYARRFNIMPFNLAFDGPGRVIFFFTVNYSNRFQGCAEMTSRVPQMGARTEEEQVMEFSVKWLRLCELPFHAAFQIKNTLQDSTPVTRASHGMEISFDAGRKLCKLMWAQPEIELPKQVVEQATDAPFSGVLPARTGGSVSAPPPHGMMGPAHKLARAAGPMSGGAGASIGGSVGGGDELGGGAPVGAGGAGSLRLLQHQQMQMQQQGPQFDGPPGFLFEIESQDFDECVGKLLFGLPARLPPHAQDAIQPGNPMFLWDPGNGLVLGIFRAVSGLSELIDRTAWARPGSMETPLPWQVRVAVDLKAPPIKAGEPILREVFRSGMVEPGALDPRQANILATTMAGRVRPPPPGVAPVPPPPAAVKAGDVGPGFNGPPRGGGGGRRGMG
ncbi:unnamed protein product, partial [Scytosiphon promiscuus]